MPQAVLLLPDGQEAFPDPSLYDDEGLVAVGGDLSRRRILDAYRRGIFPWYSEGYPPLWWSPNPRAILPLNETHISRSMKRRLRRVDFEVSWNRDFLGVVDACADRPEGGTWILPEMREAYAALHESNDAHSLEVWREGTLIGGLYGVAVGSVFAAESMFHRETNASKIALLYAASSLVNAGISLFDVQFLTPHLSSLGAVELPRSDYLSRVAAAQKNILDLNALDLVPPV